MDPVWDQGINLRVGCFVFADYRPKMSKRGYLCVALDSVPPGAEGAYMRTVPTNLSPITYC